MLGYIGFAIFFAAWYVTVIQMRRHGAGPFRRHLMGFCAAMLSGVAYIAVVGDSPKALDKAADKAQDSHIAERPAAKPASSAEWAAIQKFAQSLWSLGTRHDQAQKQRASATAVAAKKLDLHGVHIAQIGYLNQLNDMINTLKHIPKPEVKDVDAKKFIAAAHDNLNAMLLLSREQTKTIIKAIEDPDHAPSDQELADLNTAINGKTALMVISLHRLYRNYGYKDEAFDEGTFALKPSAQPEATVSFTRGES